MTIYEETYASAAELYEKAGLKRGSILVIGCSTSEVTGAKIGTNSSMETAGEICRALFDFARERGVYLAVQCCEHLNRALVMERADAERFGYAPVCVRPVPKAGGSFAAAVYDGMADPVVVEHVRADAGLDIGLTLIGMHLREVAVPVRLKTCRIGEALLTAARTRPKLIGGCRAVYPEEVR